MAPAGEWRPMLPAHMGAVTSISDIVHGAYTEDRAVLAERLHCYPAGCLVLDRGGLGRGAEITGYIITHPWRRASPPALNQPLGGIPGDADTFYLHDIALLPSERGAGAARAALDIALKLAAQGGFPDITLMAVNGADRYWASRGFTYAAGGAPSSYGEGTFLMHRPVGLKPDQP